ncbi:hypothetical protein PRIPAC_88551 [Pristionchus pacificus]|uniref:Uncharacterized protein n=1 Tax=Pristionchus pacificus TaxID=54126 RepID=A0A2A6CXG6_PRIPA|nr:hypothetical protein PRIPAC_88551 [Pristionchus pacificus]|eukprot:PDM82723.1 hypothetical protein PRIPAC_37116 [Pristionchus pacificus]
MSEETLQFSKIKFLPFGTGIHQADDGIIYYNGGSPRRLYVEWNKEKIDIDTCDEFKGNDSSDFKALGVNGEILYFTTNGQLFQGTFSSSTCSFYVDLCRDLLESETLSVREFVRRTIEGKNYAYRICDDPESDKILIDDEVECRPLIAVHRKRAYYSTQVECLTEPSIRNLFDDVYVVEFPFTFVIPNARESSRYIYFIDGHRRRPSAPVTDKNKFENLWTHKHLHTLDTNTMQFLPPVAFDTGYTKITNYSVLNGTITMAGSKDHDRDFDVFSGKDSTKDAILPPYDYCLMEAELPDGYFDVIPVDAASDAHAMSAAEFENTTDEVSETIVTLSAMEVLEKDFDADVELDEVYPSAEEYHEYSDDDSSEATITLNSDEYEEGIVNELSEEITKLSTDEREEDIIVNDIPDYAPDDVPEGMVNDHREARREEKVAHENHDHMQPLSVEDAQNTVDEFRVSEENDSQPDDNSDAELADIVSDEKNQANVA